MLRHARPVAALCLALGVVLATAGCVPEPGPSPAPTATASITPTVDAGATATPTPTAAPPALAASCEQAYSPGMQERLLSQVGPLNDPGITMLPTANADLLDLLDSAEASLRCTWGAPSEVGIATSIVRVDQEQAGQVLEVLAAAGFECEALGTGTVCRIEQRGVTLDDSEYVRGEDHYVGDGWIATTWLNTDATGYTEDIVATIWG